jgi:hypothetical protein
MSTVKISDLTAANSGDITNASDVIIINDGSTTKKITVNNFIAAAGTSIKGNLIPSSSATETTSSFELGSATSAWKELYVSTASINFVDSSGGITKWSKQDVVDLKAGKSLRTSDDKQIVHESDDKTFVQMKASAPGRVIHKVSDKSLLDMSTGSFTIGEGRVPLTITGANINVSAPTSFTGAFSSNGGSSFTGSFESSGSFKNTGSFSVKTLNQPVEFDAGTGGFADLLANFSSSGVEGGVTQGDINLDGQVNVNDLLLGLSGYGNPNTIANNILIPPNINHQYIGPTITILSPVSMSISTGSFVSITF